MGYLDFISSKFNPFALFVVPHTPNAETATKLFGLDLFSYALCGSDCQIHDGLGASQLWQIE